MQLSQLLPIETTDMWEERANKVLSHFPFKYADEIDMYEICRRFGIKIKPLDKHYFDDDDWNELYHGDLKAFTVPKPKGRRGTIYLRPGLDHIEKRIILAEEFCHCYSHHISQVAADGALVAKTEAQAKRMSAYLLMPSRFIENIYAAAAEEAVFISDIADHFVVTEEFARYRLELIYHHRVDGVGPVRNKVGSIEWLE
ncbi:ImmA/IrrE family metallo-endopeptidase [Metabacillus bambusae]|uniref:ImmA/IrrE family metallo-endopeptidase n=1 Tax=Metabacillus bambusae TaxID=2795218 RepID=A0ABS3N8C7_9BACI|nr:ImmA/IrrE family metallo-endopeptidase [Metabacillus bambusae]MBO1514300.1 ImmA/IrrE family metallo-endopeptidase [Metabacillus bambusae]